MPPGVTATAPSSITISLPSVWPLMAARLTVSVSRVEIVPLTRPLVWTTR